MITHLKNFPKDTIPTIAPENNTTINPKLICLKNSFSLKLNNNLIELPPVVIDEKNYKRKDIKNNGSLFFEGQYYNDQMNGYGILSDNINKLYSIGNYNNGAKDGPFVTFFVDKDNEISY